MRGSFALLAAGALFLSPMLAESLLGQQVADAPDQQHFVVLVVAAVAPPLHGFELRELLLPIAQHVRLHAAQFAHLTDGEVASGWNRR